MYIYIYISHLSHAKTIDAGHAKLYVSLVCVCAADLTILHIFYYVSTNGMVRSDIACSVLLSRARTMVVVLFNIARTMVIAPFNKLSCFYARLRYS